MEEEEDHEKDIEEEDKEKEEYEVQVSAKKTIQVGEKQIPVGSTLGPKELKKKICFKFTTRRPMREEELVQIKGEIVATRPPKRVHIKGGADKGFLS